MVVLAPRLHWDDGGEHVVRAVKDETVHRLVLVSKYHGYRP